MHSELLGVHTPTEDGLSEAMAEWIFHRQGGREDEAVKRRRRAGEH